jgi:excisionase family DNA binding protein
VKQQDLSTHVAGAPWSIADAATYLGVSDRHLKRLISAGKIKQIQIGARKLIADSELRRIAEQGSN